MRIATLILLALSASLSSSAQTPAATPVAGADEKSSLRMIRDLSKGGSESIKQLETFLSHPSRKVRAEAVRGITNVGTQHSIEPLVRSMRDGDSEVQILAVNGVVNFYSPGYVQGGLRRIGSAVRSTFDRENTTVIEPYVQVNPNAIAAIGKLASGGVSMESRANAARAIGVLRGKAAMPDLLQALRSKDDALMYESLIAIQKIGDPSVGPSIAYLLRDLNERVQVTVIETTGILRNKDAIPTLQRVYREDRTKRVTAAALSALAMMPDPSTRPLLVSAIEHKAPELRIAAAEGLARSPSASDSAVLERLFAEEKSQQVRLAAAFALVASGKRGTGEFDPLTYLVNGLNSTNYREIAVGYLTELSRDKALLPALHARLGEGTRDEKMGIARVLAVNGNAESTGHLERLSRDPDTLVAQQGLRSLRSLRARTP